MKPIDQGNLTHSLIPDAGRRPAGNANNTMAFDLCFAAVAAALVALVALAFVVYSISPKREVEKVTGT